MLQVTAGASFCFFNQSADRGFFFRGTLGWEVVGNAREAVGSAFKKPIV